jgi:hypothetical protein
MKCVQSSPDEGGVWFAGQCTDLLEQNKIYWTLHLHCAITIGCEVACFKHWGTTLPVAAGLVVAIPSLLRSRLRRQ